YPDQVDKLEFQNNDWTILMKGKWYYYADGKILPESYLENADKYRPFQFYHYTEELPPWVERSPEEVERFKNWAIIRSKNTLQRSGFFIDELWNASTRAETENQLVKINFLGKTAKIHKGIQQKLVIIEERIKDAAKTDSAIQKWIDNLGSLEGYGWRYIADTHSRSYHSYGLAIDLLPKSLGGKQTYWLWTSKNRSDWWNVSYNERYHPPDAVIKAFEANGFIWGGKWPMFDTMHFEYRPEVLFLNGMPPAEK
ncbi:M15 family metallopeptidase, partial [Treponema sp. R8-4-B8]